MVVFEPKIVKNKDVSQGENLPEALKDEIIGSLPRYFQDRSSVLIEPTQLINLGIEASPQIIHVAQSLSVEEKEQFTEFFKEKKINFTWTYLDMPRLDTELIMHHLSIGPDVELVRKSLEKCIHM